MKGFGLSGKGTALNKGVVIAWIFLLFQACGSRSTEQEVQNFMSRMAGLVEDGDTDGVIGLLDEGYRDFQNRDRDGTRVLVDDYFRRYRGIVVHVLANKIDRIEKAEAELRADVALSSGAAQLFRKMVRFSFDNYRFKFKLLRTAKTWKIQYAEWVWISAQEMFPESQTLLQKIMSGK